MSTNDLISDITIIGGDLLEFDGNGNFINTIATIFLGHHLMVVGRGGIHAMQLMTAEEYLTNNHPESEKTDLLNSLCADVVALNMIKDIITIRMEPMKIDRAFAADAILQQWIPKGRIKFTGLHLSEVRDALRLRGEIWRFAPAPVAETDFLDLICGCRIEVGSGIKYLYNKHTGEHVLTYEEFGRIRPLILTDKPKAIDRLEEIIHLHGRVNNQGYPELVFLLPSERNLEITLLQKILSLVKSTAHSEDIEKAENLFDRFSNIFSSLAGSELTTDNPRCDRWRATALCRLYNIDEQTTAEWALGLGPEFYLNIKWLPGARIDQNQILYEPDINKKVESLINYYRQTRNDFISINVGAIMFHLTDRDQTGEEREVYIVTLGLPDGGQEIRHVRMSKWDVKHRLKNRASLKQAINETKEYRNYIIDRLTAARVLDLPIPVFKEIHVEDRLDEGSFPVYYFEREYIPGIVTCRIPMEFYSRKGFIERLAGLLGKAAAASLVLGRRNPRSYELYFDDGDEIIQLNEEGLPERIIMIETTGSFADWTTPLSQMLPHCLKHLHTHIQKAEQQGIKPDEIPIVIGAFTDGLISEIERMQDILNDPGSPVYSLFVNRTNEPRGVRNRWENILNRLKTSDVNELKQSIDNELDQQYSALA